jgi:hypothetical protein
MRTPDGKGYPTAKEKTGKDGGGWDEIEMQ